MKKNYRIIDTLSLVSEVEANKIPFLFLDNETTISEYGEAVLKNTMLARAQLKLASGIERKMYDISAVLFKPKLLVKFNPVSRIYKIILTVDVKEENINEKRISNNA